MAAKAHPHPPEKHPAMSAQQHGHAPNATEAGDQRHRPGDRIESAAALLIAVAIIVVPALLTPDPSGHGTHVQLFLVPCIFRWLTGLPCPMCGMTTSLAHMARGEMAAAFGAHVLGPALYVGGWLVTLWATWTLVRGAPLVPEPLRRPWAPKAFLAVIGAGWLANIALALWQ